MIPISKPLIEEEEIDLVNKVLKSGHIVQGPMVEELEKDFEKLSNTKYAIALNSGTAALHTALYAIGIKPGDEVITTPFTFIATANSVLMAHANPVFVDIDEATFNINPDRIEEAITPKTKAIITVDLYGQPASYDRIMEIAKKHHLIVIDDAAQSVGATYHNKKIGEIADISCFSLYATKNLMSGEGGMITTNKHKFADRARLFRHHGQNQEKRYYYFDIGYNYRMTDLHAAIAAAQMQKLSDLTRKRIEIATRYNKELQNIQGIVTPYIMPRIKHVFHQYTLRITSKYKMNRDELQQHLLEKGIQTNIYYPIPLYKFEHLKQGKRSEMPITEQICQEVLSIPVHPNLKDEDIEYIINTIKQV